MRSLAADGSKARVADSLRCIVTHYSSKRKFPAGAWRVDNDGQRLSVPFDDVDAIHFISQKDLPNFSSIFEKLTLRRCKWHPCRLKNDGAMSYRKLVVFHNVAVFPTLSWFGHSSVKSIFAGVQTWTFSSGPNRHSCANFQPNRSHVKLSLCGWGGVDAPSWVWFVVVRFSEYKSSTILAAVRRNSSIIKFAMAACAKFLVASSTNSTAWFVNPSQLNVKIRAIILADISCDYDSAIRHTFAQYLHQLTDAVAFCGIRVKLISNSYHVHSSRV